MQEWGDVGFIGFIVGQAVRPYSVTDNLRGRHGYCYIPTAKLMSIILIYCCDQYCVFYSQHFLAIPPVTTNFVCKLF